MKSLNSIETTLKALINCGYQNIIDVCEKNIHTYSIQLSEAAQRAKDEGNSINADALALLSVACSLALNPSDCKEPFKPYIILQDKRSLMPAYFSHEHGQLFALLAPNIQCPELGARLADLSWLICKNYDTAKLAIEYYISASQSSYYQNHWYEGIERLERALRLAITINDSNKKSDIIEKLLSYINCNKDAYALRAADVVCKLLLEIQAIPLDVLAEKALDLAKQTPQGSIHEFKCTLLDVAAQCYSKINLPDKAESAKLEIAEVLLQKAEHSKASNEMLIAAHWYRQTINQLQKCKAQKEKILEIKLKLNEAIKESVKEMKRISIEMDVEKIKETAIKIGNIVIKEDKIKTLIYFALLSNKPLKRKWLEETAINTANNSPISSSISVPIYNGDGRLVAIQEPLLGSKGEKYIDALLAASYRVARLAYVSALPITLYLIDEIKKNHNIDQAVLVEILNNCIFIPNDRLNLWVKGFLAGFQGEFDVALSLLVPQFEHALRKMLEAKDVMVWRIEPDTKFHSELLLNQLLVLKETSELLGEDLQFELQGLLTERLGFNYRNQFAHGLMSEQEFYSPTTIYIWWLFFHIVVNYKYNVTQ